MAATIPSNLAKLIAENVDIEAFDSPVTMPGFDAMVWHQRFHRDPALQWLRAVFDELFATRRREQR